MQECNRYQERLTAIVKHGDFLSATLIDGKEMAMHTGMSVNDQKVEPNPLLEGDLQCRLSATVFNGIKSPVAAAKLVLPIVLTRIEQQLDSGFIWGNVRFPDWTCEDCRFHLCLGERGPTDSMVLRMPGRTLSASRWKYWATTLAANFSPVRR